MTNHHTKLEDPWAMSSLIIDQKSLSTDRPSNRPTDGPTCAKQYTHTSSKGSIKILNCPVKYFFGS